MKERELTDLCTLNMGQSPESSTYNEQGNGLPFFQGNADFGELHPTVRVWCSAPTKIANAGDILISVRAPIGAMNIAEERCCIGRGLAALTPDLNICSQQYLYYALQSRVDRLIAQGTGSTFKAISKKVLEQTRIPVYPLDEQLNIVKRLEKVEQIISIHKQQLATLDELVKARFIEMFGNPVLNEKHWHQVHLSSCLKSIDNGKSFVCDSAARQGDWPAVLKLSAATYGYYRPEENKAMLDKNQFVEEAAVHTGDLLFTGAL